MQSICEPTSALRDTTNFCQGPCKSHLVKSHMYRTIFAHCDKHVAQKFGKGTFTSVGRTFYDHLKDSDSCYEAAKVCHDGLPISLLTSGETTHAEPVNLL